MTTSRSVSTLSGNMVVLSSGKIGADYSQYTSLGEGLLSIAKLTLDGQISTSFDLKKYLPDFLPSQILTQEVDEFAVDHERWRDCPNMNIVIMIVGSRGKSTTQ
jgi:sterol 3beta-glucosyltransferase